MSEERDKIFGNAYNTGSYDFEQYRKFEVDDDFDYLLNKTDYTEFELDQLRNELYDIFQKASFYEKYKKIKKVPKSEIFNIYYHFVNSISDLSKYTTTQVFTEIAEFMRLNYKDTFHILLPTDKQKIIMELHNEHHVLNHIKIKRLF